ncbi:glycoside hydrolase family 127 protein [Amycolatopsis sp. A133]|uniref:beta-L-arabinofuranosidase domain-containing protein n=1 Tax=Amycolatopsis sp. A133 TaxID=3064472 RepID=UPI0027EC77EF|nr:beta-L-arabinofuranosidase domain-containing protein [Amycolatopsis sp. A133]MDQ7807753.1 glycoside hydrolase family 127 protein [Amycolatopsis sp. A133]
MMREPTFDRRLLLKAVGALSASAALAPALAGPAAAAARPDIGVSVFPFPLGAVRLQAGPFLDNMNRQLAYFRFVDADRLLHTFRTNAGLASAAQPCGGWESPSTELRGHSTGHLLSGLAQAYANTGDTTYKTKGDYLVTALAACQAASPGRGFHAGYLSAFPENFFDRLEAGQSVWAPYYTLHKIMAGLLDQYLLAGNQQALDVLLRKAVWTKARTDPLPATQMQQVLRTEFGGMPEVLANLYQVTGDPNHLATAQRFDHAQILDPLAAGQDRLAGFHANTQIPKIIGAIREYHATGTTRYRDIAVNFWRIVLDHHSYVIGGNSDGEYFQTPDAIASRLSDTTCEVCNTYNMLKLTRQLFFTSPVPEYMDYYELALFNQILGEQDPASGHGFVTYYTPLRAGGIKTYANDYDDFTCDHGTGMESQTKFADSVYAFSGETLYVNLFLASVLTWPGRGITVRQDTTFPASSGTKLTIGGSGHIALKIRIPRWTSGAVVKVNGVAQGSPAPGSYFTIDRTWAPGDVVDVTLPASLTFPRTNDDAGAGAVKYGAIVLAGQYGSTNLSALPTLQTATLKQDPANPLRFTGTASTGAVTLLPFYATHHQRYTVYWRLNGTPPTGTSYEAEAATLGGQAAVRTSSGASGGALVGYVGGGSANYLQFSGVTASAGAHPVTIFYASGESRSLTVSVNGGASTSVSTPGTGGWDTVGSVQVTLNLAAGANTIRLGNPSGWGPDIDRIVVG